jgi:rhomboid domain-containing protein 1
MLSLMWKGSQLEPEMGTEAFSFLCLFCLVVSHTFYLVICYFLLEFADYSESYYSCAVGFSAVLFALKYVLNARSEIMTNIYGINLPLKWAAWAELLVASMVSANVSFVGHLAGILAGIVWVHLVPILSPLGQRRRRV